MVTWKFCRLVFPLLYKGQSSVCSISSVNVSRKLHVLTKSPTLIVGFLFLRLFLMILYTSLFPLDFIDACSGISLVEEWMLLLSILKNFDRSSTQLAFLLLRTGSLGKSLLAFSVHSL